MYDDREKRLADFIAWVKQHITGDEKGEAQIFLDRLMQAFGQRGLLEIGGKAEFRIKKSDEDGGGTSFADYVWKPIVLIEMKKRGEDLRRHYRQAFDYWIRLVPGRPQYTVLCNFDEFWIYDFDQQIDDPMDKLALSDLPEHWGPLAFLFPTQEKPKFRIDRIKVTREAADKLATCYTKLEARKNVGPLRAQRFILQMLIALFSEDIGLLPKYFVSELLDDCEKDLKQTFDLLNGLFTAMGKKGGIAGGRFKEVPYFNGGIFSEPAPVELHIDELNQLRRAAKDYDWSHISPDIFGTIFQHSMQKEERHAFGGHYTTQQDIMKIVGPTIVEPWRSLIENATTLEQLHHLRERMARYRVLDPACGSGNFLYVAYRELKRLEKRLGERIIEKSPKKARDVAGQLIFGAVTSRQFFGMDITPFAVELAKVTMTLAHKLAIDELHIQEQALPLDNLDKNITCTDALIHLAPGESPGADSAAQTKWPAADVIIGNPPFLGAKRLKPERGVDYVNAVRKLYPEVPGMADYCVYWLRRAHDHLPDCTPEDPVAGRAGLVGTQNIRNNQSRVGGLDHIVKSGVIVEAVDNQPWSGEANVHVSIANWVKTPKVTPNTPGAKHGALLIPGKKKLWQRSDPVLPLFLKEERSTRAQQQSTGNRRSNRKDKIFELVFSESESINSSLSNQQDVSQAKILSCNHEPPIVFNGQFPRHQGFVLSPKLAAEMIKQDRRNEKVVHPYLIGREMITGVRPDRWVIDFQKMDILTAKSYSAPFKEIENTVLPHVQGYADKERKSSGRTVGQDQTWLKSWWQHFRCRKELIDLLEQLPRYLACAEVTKRPIFCFVASAIRPDHTLEAFVLADDYSFGILQSNAHWQWFVAKCSKLKSDFRYTPESVFDTFPWPQSPTKKQINAVADAGREVRRIRDAALLKVSGGLRAVYRTLELPGKNPLKDAHAALDAAVLDAYGFSPNKDLLAQLLALNLEVARRIDKGQPVTAPGVPPSLGDPAPLITKDCIQP